MATSHSGWKIQQVLPRPNDAGLTACGQDSVLESCHAEHLVAFSCKRRGFCPSCGARHMADNCMDAGSTTPGMGEELSGRGYCDRGPLVDQLSGYSITYQIAVGPQAGRKVFTLRTLFRVNV